MNTLLKDLPEHKERIENNSFLEKDIFKIIDSYSEYSMTADSYRIDRENFEELRDEIIEKITEFVNENYEWKGIKA